MTRYRCKECDAEFESDTGVPPDRCPNEECNAKFGGGWADNIVRIG